jgi:hypothetical protein
MKPFCLHNPKVLPFLAGFPNLLHTTLRRKIVFLRNIRNLNLIIITVFFHIIINWSKQLLRQIGWTG